MYLKLNPVSAGSTLYSIENTGKKNFQTPATETFDSSKILDGDIFESSVIKDEKDFDYSLDDGKISTFDKVKNFAKGVISPITAMFSSPGNLLLGAGMIAGSAALIAATGGALAPVLVTLGLAGGAVQLGTSAYKASKATTDEEARQAWQGIGAGTSAIVSSVAGSKGALKTAGVDTSKMSFLEATVQCVKQTPKSVSKSVSAFIPNKGLTLLESTPKPENNVKEQLALPENTETAAKPAIESKVADKQLALPEPEKQLALPEKSEALAVSENQSLTELEAPKTQKLEVLPKKEAATPNAEYRLSEKSIKAGSSYLAQEGTPEYEALTKLVGEEFVSVPDKESVMEIFRREFSSLDIQSGDDVFVLNPNDAAKCANKKVGTSNTYMSEWYAEANGLDGKVLTLETLQEALSQSTSDKLTIIVPDDCAITGRSMIVETARALNGVDMPDGKSVKLIYSPMIESSTSASAFDAAAAFDIDGLSATKILNTSDDNVMSTFFNKYNGKLDISKTPGTINAKPYYESSYFQALKLENPELAQAIEAILTNNGTANGYGRPGTSGVMIATPTADGISLKCPNNNVFGAAPYALAEGASFDTIKRPGVKIGGTKTSAAKWQVMLKQMIEEMGKIA